MGVVRFWPAELIILNDWPRASAGRTAGKILKKAAPTVITHQDVELAIRPKSQNAAVVISAQRLIRIGLIGAQLDQIAIEGQRRAIPNITIDPVRQRLKDVREIRRVGARAALS